MKKRIPALIMALMLAFICYFAWAEEEWDEFSEDLDWD